MTEGMVLMPWWTPLLLGLLFAVCVGASAWFDHYSKARLKEAIDYWQRSKAIWDAIDAAPDAKITDEAALAMQEFCNKEADQTLSLPTDYVKPAA